MELALPFSRQTKAADEWFYFLHIPKAAGTSLRYALYEKFRAHEVYPNNVDYYFRHRAKYISVKQLQQRKEQLFPQWKKLLIGHFQLFPLDKNFRSPPPRSICFLRHPVDRVVSSIDYLRASGRRYQGLSFEQVLSEYGEQEGRLQACSLGYKPRRRNMQQVLENLEKIDVLGVVEHYRRSIQLINREFNWELNSDYRKNVSAKTHGAASDNMLREQVAAYCELDLTLYEYGLKRFEAHCRKWEI